MMKAMVWQFVRDTHKVMSYYHTCHVAFKVLCVEFALQCHQYSFETLANQLLCRYWLVMVLVVHVPYGISHIHNCARSGVLINKPQRRHPLLKHIWWEHPLSCWWACEMSFYCCHRFSHGSLKRGEPDISLTISVLRYGTAIGSISFLIDSVLLLLSAGTIQTTDSCKAGSSLQWAPKLETWHLWLSGGGETMDTDNVCQSTITQGGSNNNQRISLRTSRQVWRRKGTTDNRSNLSNWPFGSSKCTTEGWKWTHGHTTRSPYWRVNNCWGCARECNWGTSYKWCRH